MSCSQGELVGGSFYEGFEGVARVQPHSHALACTAFQRGGFRWLVKRSVEFGRQMVGGVGGGQLFIHVGRSVGLNVDEELALAGTNFV